MDDSFFLKLQVKCACADTTASVTGSMKGAITLLQKDLKRELLYLASRRHEYETILEEAALQCLGPTRGPEEPLFKSFKNKWRSLDKGRFQTGPSDEYVLVDGAVLPKVFGF